MKPCCTTPIPNERTGTTNSMRNPEVVPEIAVGHEPIVSSA